MLLVLVFCLSGMADSAICSVPPHSEQHALASTHVFSYLLWSASPFPHRHLCPDSASLLHSHSARASPVGLVGRTVQQRHLATRVDFGSIWGHYESHIKNKIQETEKIEINRYWVFFFSGPNMDCFEPGTHTGVLGYWGQYKNKTRLNIIYRWWVGGMNKDE